MFRAMFLPIIRSTSLYLQHLIVFTQVAVGWCHGWVETTVLQNYCALVGVIKDWISQNARYSCEKNSYIYFFNYFFNIPNNAHNIYTLKITEFHIKTLNTCPYMFRSLFKNHPQGPRTSPMRMIFKKETETCRGKCLVF